MQDSNVTEKTRWLEGVSRPHRVGLPWCCIRTFSLHQAASFYSTFSFALLLLPADLRLSWKSSKSVSNSNLYLTINTVNRISQSCLLLCPLFFSRSNAILRHPSLILHGNLDTTIHLLHELHIFHCSTTSSQKNSTSVQRLPIFRLDLWPP